MKPVSSLARRLGSLGVLLLPALGSGLAPARLSAQEADPRIRAVEEGITRGIQVQGRDGERFTILERMANYNVPGVSVASGVQPMPRYTEVALVEVPEEILQEIAGTYEGET